MKRVFWIARREFVATVTTKGFIIGILFTPILIVVMIYVMPILLDDTPPRVEGELAVLDSTGVVTEDIAAWLEPEAVARRAGELAEALDEAMPEAVREIGLRGAQGGVADRALEAILAQVPDIRVASLPLDADIEAEKAALLVGSVTDGGRLAVAVFIRTLSNATRPEPSSGTTTSSFARGSTIVSRMRSAERCATRSSRNRVRSSGLDRDEIGALTRVRRVRSTTVTREGEQETNEVLNMMLLERSWSCCSWR